MNKGFNAPRFIETFGTPDIPSSLFGHLEYLKREGELQHLRIPGGTVSQDYSPVVGGGNWVFKDGQPLSDYIDMLKKVNVPVIYVANLLKPNTVGETLYALAMLKSNGITVLGVELGNELIAFKERHGIKYNLFVEATDKVALANLILDLETHIIQIRRQHPDIKISVPVAKSGNLVNKRFNEEMFKLDVDAYSYHVYIDFGKEDSQLKNHGYNIGLFRSRGKEVWITEYNMQFNNPATNKTNWLSPKHMDMLYNRMPKLFQDKGCSIISRHSLWGNDNVSPFFPHISIDSRTNSFIVND